MFFINLVSAVSYECSDGGLLKKSQKEIDINNRKSINELGLGLIYADEAASLGRFAADLIIDAHKFSLTDQIPSIELEFKSGTKNITLVNLTNNIATIKIGGSSDSIENGDTVTVGGFETYLYKTEGSYPGIATVEGITGEDKISLSNNEQNKIVSLDSIDYHIELYSASDTNVVIIVEKCENKTAKIIEIQDEVEENITEFTENSTLPNDELNESETEIDNITQEGVGIGVQIKENIKSRIKINSRIFFIFLTIIIGLIIVFFLIRHMINKKEVEELNRIKSIQKEMG